MLDGVWIGLVVVAGLHVPSSERVFSSQRRSVAEILAAFV